MNRYQQIREELLSLGWTEKTGRGDHMMFDKPGNRRPIPISINLNERNNAYINTIAHIRQIEPRFRLGLPTPKKERTDNTEPVPETPTGVPDWAAYGLPVRWTAPEQKDYAKINEPESVMNRRYTVKGFSIQDGKPTIILSDTENEFTVQPEDIDAWETEKCADCGTILPVNTMSLNDDGNLICENCEHKRAEEIRRTIEANMKIKINDQPELTIPKLTGDAAILDEKYKNISIGNLPDDKKQEFLKEAKSIMDRLNSKGRKQLAKARPDIIAYLQMLENKNNEESKPLTPYQAWKMFLNNTIEETAHLHPELYRNNANYKAMAARYYKSSYRVDRIQDKASGKAITVINIITPDQEITESIWSHNGGLFWCFAKTLKQKEPMCCLLTCPSEGIKQVIIDKLHDKVPGLLEFLEQQLADNAGCTNRAKLDAALPGIAQIKYKLDKVLVESTEDNAKHISSTINLALREEDKFDFENAKPHYLIRIKINDLEYEKRTLETIKQAIDNMEYDGCPMSIYVYYLSTETNKEQYHKTIFGNWYDNTATDNPIPGNALVNKEYLNKIADRIRKKEPFGIKPGDTLLRFANGPDGNLTVDAYEGQNNDTYIDMVAQATHDILLYDRPASHGILKGITLYMDELEANKKLINEHNSFLTDKNKTKMENTYNFNQTNPKSNNKIAGSLTDRELIRELKDRGYIWQNLRKTILVDIDDSNI